MAASENPEQDAVFVTDLSKQLEASQWLPEAWQPYWDLLAEYPVLGAIGLVVSAYVLALLTRFLIVWFFEKLALRSKTQIDNIIFEHLKRPLFTTTFALGLIAAVQISGVVMGRGLLVNLFASWIIVSWMLAGLKLSSDIMSGLGANPKFALVEPRTIPLFDLVMKLGILLLASYSLLLVWGINPVGWLASAGIVGIAVGFAAKDTLANLFSGLFILADAPYKIGDYINLDSGERGQVTGIGMRSTRLLTRSDVEITVPNAVIANAKITNESGGPNEKMRIRLGVGVAYGTDVDRVCEILLSLGEDHENTCAYPAPRVRMRGFGASSLDFELLCWIDQPADRGRISHELFMKIYKAFAEAGIEIPFAKQDVYIKEMPKA
jgi:small-conductance mechanosensitive channel